MHYLGPRVRSARLLRSLTVRTLALVSPLSIAPDARVPNRWHAVRSRDAHVENLMEYTCARMMGEHCKMLPAAHPVSALEINSGAPPATLSRLPLAAAIACGAAAAQATCRLLAPSQNDLPISQVIHAKTDERDGAASRFLAAALAGLALVALARPRHPARARPRLNVTKSS